MLIPLYLGVLMSVVQAGPPIPRQTPNGSAGTSKTDQKNANSKNRPAYQVPAAINESEQPQEHDEPTEGQSQTDAQHPITIRELPPVTINSRRDWADWGTWLFTFLLAVTGGFQVWLLCRTLAFSRRQTIEMQKQRNYMGLQWNQMVEAGKQTERIIAQMKETEVRDLRAYVGISKVILLANDVLQPTGAVELQNFGKTPAYNVRQWIGIAPQSHPLTVTLPEPTGSVTASVSTMYPGVKSTLRTKLKNRFPEGINVGTPELTLYVYGKVTYDDIFGNHWYTNYRFIFGGPEGGQISRNEDNSIHGVMGLDSEGNDAT
jgi:hypothetical protein